MAIISTGNSEVLENQEVAAQGSSDNILMRDVVGNKNDLPWDSSLLGLTKSAEGKVLDVQEWGAIHVAYNLTVDGNAAQTDNIFTVNGSVRILGLWGTFIDATDTTTISASSWTVYDGTNTVDITESAVGTNLSGAGQGDVVVKNAAAGTALTHLSATQVRVSEGTDASPVYPCLIVQKSSTSTWIRFNFTGDINTNAQIEFHVVYQKVSTDGEVLGV